MPQQRTITLSYANHRQQAVVRIEFAWDAELAAQVKPFDGARWRQTMRCWYVLKQQFDVHPAAARIMPGFRMFPFDDLNL